MLFEILCGRERFSKLVLWEPLIGLVGGWVYSAVLRTPGEVVILWPSQP